MTNKEIAQQFSLMSKLLDIHQQDPFRSKSYSIAAYYIEQLPGQVAEMEPELLFAQKGIGAKTGARILEVLETGGPFSLLREWWEKTPPGVLEMLNIKGLGAKKIGQIWKEMGLETLGELEYACHENRLLDYKGFGAKTQESILRGIAYYRKTQGWHLLAPVWEEAQERIREWRSAFPDFRWEMTGPLRRQVEIIEIPELITDTPEPEFLRWMEEKGGQWTRDGDSLICTLASGGLKWRIYCCSSASFMAQWWKTTGSETFITSLPPFLEEANWADEEAYFAAQGMPSIPAALRDAESPYAARLSAPSPAPLIQFEDIKGIIHSHTQWSDGRHSLREMALAARDAGWEYLVVSDHSRSATYAKGLSIERLEAQILEIDALNAELHPFVIFKSVEADILGNGSLDYPDELLARLDMVIASVHSQLNMSEEKARERLWKAIENPYTTVLGHPTGRLLLTRPGYPVDHQALIDHCARHQVVIEINAHPRRLDMDWRWIPYAQEKKVLVSINPDAHSIDGFQDIRYGVMAAQKGGLEPRNNLSSFSREELADFLVRKREERRNGS